MQAAKRVEIRRQRALAAPMNTLPLSEHRVAGDEHAAEEEADVVGGLAGRGECSNGPTTSPSRAYDRRCADAAGERGGALGVSGWSCREDDAGQGELVAGR